MLQRVKHVQREMCCPIDIWLIQVSGSLKFTKNPRLSSSSFTFIIEKKRIEVQLVKANE